MTDLTRRQPPEQTPPGQLGFVTRAPAAAGDPFEVTVPGFSSQHFYEIVRWQSRGSTLPQLEDEVLVVVDDKEGAWVAAWWPAAGDDPVIGEPGPEGPPGPAGPEGPAGVDGDDGAEGPQGKEGKEGPQGVAGPEGPKGKEGPAGAEGPKGKEGAAGPEGPKGATGAAGATWYEGAGAPGAGLGANGDFYLRTDNGFVYHKVGGAWEVVGDLTGPKGDPGPGAPFSTWNELVEEYATWKSLTE